MDENILKIKKKEAQIRPLNLLISNLDLSHTRYSYGPNLTRLRRT